MDENEDLPEYNPLITRSKAHFQVTAGSSEIKSTPVRKSDRNEEYGLFCKTHKNTKHLECLLLPLQDSFPNGQVPTTGQVFSYHLTVNKQRSGKNNVTNVASEIMLHWISCDIYTMTCRNWKP